MAILTFAKKQKYMPKCSMLKWWRDIYPGRIDMIMRGAFPKLVFTFNIIIGEKKAEPDQT